MTSLPSLALQYDSTIHHDGLLYDCGVELSSNGQFGRQDYKKHACRGTYTLHSLYLLLWANFSAFCLALLTQPDADKHIHGPIISEKFSVRHYCVSQLRILWMHLLNNLGLSEEQRSFFTMRAMNRLREVSPKHCIKYRIYHSSFLLSPFSPSPPPFSVSFIASDKFQFYEN